MSPGLTGQYDWGLREKAGERQPPPPPEYMGVEGEYDTSGLAKRVAIAFDRDANLAGIETLELSQDGSTIHLKGSVPNQAMLEQLVAIASAVDGTKAVDTAQVVVQSGRG